MPDNCGLVVKGDSEHTYSSGAGATVVLVGTGQQLRAIDMNCSRHSLRVKFRRGEPLDKDHRTATARALPYRSRTGFWLDGTGTAASGHIQELLAERQQSFASAVCQEAEEADAHKAMRKHMQEEAAQKLLSCDRHEFLFAAASQGHCTWHKRFRTKGERDVRETFLTPNV